MLRRALPATLLVVTVTSSLTLSAAPSLADPLPAPAPTGSAAPLPAPADTGSDDPLPAPTDTGTPAPLPAPADTSSPDPSPAPAGTGSADLAAAPAADDFGAPVQRWRDLVTGGAAVTPADPVYAKPLAALDDKAAANLATLADGRWPDATSTDGATVGTAAARIKDIALAYATAGSRYHGDRAAADAAVAALRWLHDNRYRPGAQELGNWWFWEIGGPNHLLDSLLLLGDAVPEDLRVGVLATVAHFVPDPARRKISGVPEVGANLVDKVSITVRRGLLARDPAVLSMARDKLSPVFDLTASGDGWYPDGSLIQHFYFAYTGGYGTVLLDGVARVLTLLAGTPWQITDPDSGNVTTWVFDGFEPVLFRGQMFANVRGRGISRPASDDFAEGRAVVAAMAMLAHGAPAEVRQRIAGVVAEHVSAAPFYDHATVAQVSLVRGLVEGVAPRGDLTLTKVFAGMDRLVHHRPGHAFSVSARGSRVGAYEAGNGENLKGWYTGDGMTSIYNDRPQYSDGFWPTVDPYRLPGVTNATAETYPRTARDTNWYGFRQSDPHTGGVAMGDLSAFGMRLIAERDYHSKQPIDLKARKSWFTVGDTIVALGSDITAAGVAAQTTVENRMGAGRLTQGEHWMHLEGVGGYLFPHGLPKTLRESRTGAWSDIGTGGREPLTRDYTTLWFDHGNDPRAASYAYYLLPGRSAAETAEAARRTNVRIGDNTAAVQSVVTADGVNTRLAATFWSCATTQDTVRAYGPAAVTLHQEGATLDLAVADPTWKQGRMLFEVAREGREVLAADPRVTVLTTSPTIRFTVDAADALGAGVKLKVKVRPTARPALTGPSCEQARQVAAADTYVRGGVHAGTSFNGKGLVVKTVSADPGYTRISYLRFDPPPATTGPATLWIRAAVQDADGDSTTLTLYEAPASGWDEATLTWNDRPALGRPIGTVTVTGKTPAWYSVDVTGHLGGGYALSAPDRTLAVGIGDRETPGAAPFLQLY
ncbi:polysaccharide lyase family 8 super-sandwich domain-containing protein [Nonomuraea sp. NPDC003754]